MGRKRPESVMVEAAYLQNSKRKAHEIAEETGLIESMGYEKAIAYVRKVKKRLKAKGQIQVGAYASDDERLNDVTILFDLRKGMELKRRTAYVMLLLNCYYRLRSQDDDIHMMAVDDTYEKNREFEEPFGIHEAIQICEAALAQYMNSIDEAQNEAAKKRGYPGAGLNYTDERFIDTLAITEKELQHMTSIKKG